MAVGKSKQKKMNVRVDFTPMVDMMMLLITFFMLCTSLAKPQTMELSMPSNDKNMQDQDKTVTKESYTVTIYCAANDKVYYVHGQIKPDDPKCLVETSWAPKGLRAALYNIKTEDGAQPVKAIMQAKEALDKEREDPTKVKMPDSVYNKRLSQIKSGVINGQKLPGTLTVIIKATDNSSYKNLVDALDEMQICGVAKYVIDKINDTDLKLLKENNVAL